MYKIEQKLQELAKNIISIRGGYTSLVTWNEYIKTFESCLETITYLKRRKNISNNDWIALRRLTEELLKLDIACDDVKIKSYKRDKLSNLKNKIKTKLESIPYIEEEKEEIKTIDDWVKSLKIFKLSNSYLSKEYYETSYDLYQNIRKIILTKNPSDYKRIYVGKVVKELDRKNKRLPSHLNLEIEDYELTELIRLIKDNPDFNYHLMPFKYQNAIINDRFDRQDWANKLLLLVKK